MTAKMSKTIGTKVSEEDRVDEKLIDPPIHKLPDHVSRMWELPQIYEFLCFAKDTLHIENLSMYEMERMLSMPKASKQLANIMTSLLSSSMPRSRLLKIPPMPYEFWTDVLLNHKVNNWLKVYESKEYDSVKVLEAIGIEPDFWTIFPDVAAITQCDFDELNIRQRVWLLKTVCDTMMHGKKSLQDEVANRYLDGEGEKVLGRDRYGARYVYFPIFLNNDIRIYKHNLNNKILLNATPIAPKLKIHARRVYNQHDRRRKKSRWKYGDLPQRQKKRKLQTIKMKNDQLKCNINMKPTDEETLENTRSQVDLESNVNPGEDDEDDIMRGKKERKMEKQEEHMDEEMIEYSEVEKKEEHVEVDKEERTEEMEDTEVTNVSAASKSLEVEKSDSQPHPDDASSSSKTDDEKINDIKTITSSENNSVVCSLKVQNGEISKSDDEKLIETKTFVENNDDDVKFMTNNGRLKDQVGLKSWMKALMESNDCKEAIKDCHDENSRDSFMENSDCIRTRSKTIYKREMKNFNNILMDLGVSTFELVADSVQSLRELIVTLSAQNSIVSSEPIRCELLLIKKLKALAASLKPKELLLKASTENARKKLEREWRNFRDGINDDEASNGARYASKWVLGSQGCPLLSCTESLHHDGNDNDQSKSENEDDVDEEEEDRTRGKTETRRVLRARGVSSYMEQFSSDDDTDASNPEGWAEIVDPATGIHLGSSVQADGGAEEDEGSEGSGSDQDWILPGERKRKSKRISMSRRSRSLQYKLQNIDVDVKYTESTSSLDVDNKQRIICPKSACDKIKIESVHSEYHIKDEAPIIEQQPANNKTPITNYASQQNYVLHQVVNTPNGPMNYVVMPQDNPPIAQPPQMVSVMPHIRMQPTYYMPTPRGYLVSNTQVSQVRPSFINQQNLPPMHNVIIQPNHQTHVTPSQNFVQYQQLRMAPPVPIYPTTAQQHITNQPIKVSTQPPKMQPRIVQNRQIVPPYRPRHPVGAVIRSTVPFRAEARPSNNGKGRGSKAVTPRHPTASRNVRPPKTNVKASGPNDASKTTSLIVLSDSDDEIEMIIPQKNNESQQQQTKSKKRLSSQHKVLDNNKLAIAPTTGADNQSSSQSVLTSQIIQRMSQGGISITPIKPKASPQSSPISPTQLVVVVNETGSHYALALPNGSKLILTPEQVAQIRASNGGKLVL